MNRVYEDLRAVGPSAVTFDGGRSIFDTAITDIALEADGKMLVGNGNDLLLRLTHVGGLDTSLAQPSGLPGLPVTYGEQWTVQPDGKILVFRWYNPPQDVGGNHEFAVTRYNPDGSPDLLFGSDGAGTAIIDVEGADSYPEGLAVQSDGNIVFVGTQYNTTRQGWDFELMRLIGQVGQAHSPEGTAVSLQGYATDVNPTDLNYAWSVTKDGNAYSLPAGTLTTGTQFTFTPDAAGTYVVTLTVNDPDGDSASATTTLVVDDAAPIAVHITQPSITSGGLVSFTTTAFGPTLADERAGYTYTINWGDGTVQNPDLTTIPASANNGSGAQPAPHAYAPGIYTVTVTATEDGGQNKSTTALIVVSATTGDNISISADSGGNATVNTTDEGNFSTASPPDQVLAASSGGSNTYTVNFGSNLTTPIILSGGGDQSGDTLIVNGDTSSTNVINKTPGQITWGSPVTDTVFRAGIPNTTINANGTSTNYVNDPGSNTTINGGPGANFITITATTGNGVVIHGGPNANTYTLYFE